MILKCEDVSFSYSGEVVVSDINFEVEKGDFLSIVGENGSGKSTLIMGILGLLKPHKGKITLGDNMKKGKIGYLPQQTDFQKDFPTSVFEVVISGCLNSMGIRPFYTKKEKKIAEKNMMRLKISDLKGKCYHDLSGGQKQKVLLARALCSAGDMLLLDEPVTGLDPVSTMEMYNIIKELNEKDKMTIIMVSHDVKNAVLYSRNILHLHNKPLYFGDAKQYSYDKIKEEK